MSAPFESFRFLLFTLLLGSASVATAEPDPVARLLDGVRTIGQPGVPGPVALIGPDAFAVVPATAGDGTRQAVVAAATPGRGRVVAFGHGGYLSSGILRGTHTGTLVLNAVAWAARGKKDAVVGLVGHGGLATFLGERKVRTVTLDRRGWTRRLGSIDVLVLSDWNPGGAAGEAALERYVSGGGGLITAGLAWGWMQLHPAMRLDRDHRLNAVLARFGLLFADGTFRDVPAIPDPVDRPALAACHAGRALARLEDRERGAPGRAEASQISAVLTTAVRAVPETASAFRNRVATLVGAGSGTGAGARIPTQRRPIRSRDVIDRLAVLLAHDASERAGSDGVVAAPSAADFPGTVPDGTPRVRKTVVVDLSVPGWASTGLHAVPGETIAIVLPEGAPAKGLAARIGCHTDRLWGKDAWRRHPEISRRFPLAGRRTSVASPHGGLVYLDVPRGRGGRLEIEIAGAVPAPLYVLGETDARAWREEIRLRPGPWAELACSKVILTVRSRDVRGLDDPEALMRFWDGALDLYAELGGRPLDRRPQRIVCDRQISAGYMHSGYPIMTLLDQSDRMTSLEKLRAGAWGLWHELGHNHQRREWTFAGTTEVTCNLFSLFVEQRVRGLKPAKHPWPEPKWKKVVEHFEGDRSFERWKRDPGLALWTYVLVQDAFGWKPFQDAFAVYARMPPGTLPKTDAEKRDGWLVRLSRATGRNLGPYFEAWKIPTSKTARESVAELPVWMPDRLVPLLR